MQLVASPCLSQDDIDAIETGYKDRQDVIYEAACRSLNDIHDKICADRLSALAWLISGNKLDVKLALKIGADGKFTTAAAKVYPPSMCCAIAKAAILALADRQATCYYSSADQWHAQDDCSDITQYRVPLILMILKPLSVQTSTLLSTSTRLK